MKRPIDELRELPPGINEVPCAVELRSPGEFTSQLHLYVDDGGTRELVFTVRGTAAARE